MSHSSLKDQLQAVAAQLSDAFAQQPKPNQRPRTSVKPRVEAEKAKKAKPQWLEYAQYGVELLKAHFPACFKAAHAVQPLKKGIKQDLVKWLSSREDIVTSDKACMVKSLTYYVNTAAYLKSVVAGAKRIDLEGNPTAEVTPEEAQYSAEKYQTKRQAKQGSLIPAEAPAI